MDVVSSESHDLLKSKSIHSQICYTLSENNAAPLVNVSMKIEIQSAFTTQIAVATSNFNLLSMRDLSRVYDVNIRGGKASLIPRSPAGTTEVNAINTVVPNPTTVPPVDNVVIPVSPLNLNENQIQMGVMLVAVLLILGILS